MSQQNRNAFPVQEQNVLYAGDFLERWIYWDRYVRLRTVFGMIDIENLPTDEVMKKYGAVDGFDDDPLGMDQAWPPKPKETRLVRALGWFRKRLKGLKWFRIFMGRCVCSQTAK